MNSWLVLLKLRLLKRKRVSFWRFLGLGLVLGHSKPFKVLLVIGLLRILATWGKR